jgi:hypothetical protein
MESSRDVFEDDDEFMKMLDKQEEEIRGYLDRVNHQEAMQAQAAEL